MPEERPARLPDQVRITGRILFLTEDPELIRRQLAGENLDFGPARSAGELPWPLRHDISTDEITPAWICYYHDETLGEFPYLGLKAGEAFPIARGAVKAGGFAVSVSGRRRGKGSSREQSPYAELKAGIRLVIAESIERIYRQNCQNLGILTSTDFDLLARLRRGEALSRSDFTKDADPITRGIIEYGGLYNYNRARLRGDVQVATPATPPRPMTLAEKIIARHWIADSARGKLGLPAVQPGDAGFLRSDLRFSHEYVTPMAAMFFEEELGQEARVADPGSVVFFRDHLTFLDEAITPERRAQGLLDVAQALARTQERFARAQGIKLHGELTDRKGSEAICHSLVIEHYALPGQVVTGSDSHTPHTGAIGALAFGVGTTDVFNSWITRDVRLTVPPQVLVQVDGPLPPGVVAKDVILAILRVPYVKGGQALGKLVEYAGSAVRAMDIDERATLTNMAAEVGAFTGIVAADERTVEFLVERRGVDRRQAQRWCAGWASDPGAHYEHTIRIDGTSLSPMVATPGDPGNGVFLSELADPPRVDIAYGGSCTGGKIADMDMYARVLREAEAQGQRVAEGVTFYIQFGSQATRDYCAKRGYLELFARLGVQVIEPACGACINAGPGVSKTAQTVTVSAINRNFPGRSGPGQVYLASPLTVAASAVAGYLAAWVPRDAAKAVAP